jgi:hypothetical protein
MRHVTAMQSDVATLRREILEAHPKLTFTRRLQRLLAFTSLHPELAGEIGAVWTNDGVTFLTNSTILSTFLNLKGNTINANFRQHQFGHASDIFASAIPAMLPALRTPLPDGQHWKRRQHARNAFTSATTDAEAADLDTDSRMWLHQPFADAAQKKWCALIGDCECIPMEILAHALVPHNADEQIRINCMHLLAQGADIHTGMIDRNAFMAFFRRYAAAGNCVMNVTRMTPPIGLAVDGRPCFYVGICLGTDRTVFTNEWQKASNDAWALIDADEPGVLYIMTKTRCRDNKDQCMKIVVDPIAERRGWAIQMDDDVIMCLDDLDGVLEYLGLSKLSGLNLPDYQVIRHEPWESTDADYSPSPFVDSD